MLNQFVADVNAQGGIRFIVEGVPALATDEDWIDLALTYRDAYAVLTRAGITVPCVLFMVALSASTNSPITRIYTNADEHLLRRVTISTVCSEGYFAFRS